MNVELLLLIDMKKRAFFLSLLIFCGISTVFFPSYASSAVPESTEITTALKQKEAPELIKALILHMKDQLEIDEDRFPELIHEVETYTASCKDTAATAVLHSMTAELYHMYYERFRWTIDQRTPLYGYVPNDMREWTRNLFQDKIRKELALSLQPTQVLQTTPTRSFQALLTLGKDTERLRPTLFEFLAFRAVRLQPSDKIYTQIIAFQNKKPNMKAVVLTELEYYRYLFDQKRDKAAFDRYLNALNEMYRNHATQDFSVEILIAKLDLIAGNRYRYTANKANAIQAEEIAICKEGIRRFPNYPRTAVLRNRLAVLEQPTLSVATSNVVYPGQKLALKVSYKNIDQIKVQIFHSLKSPLQAEHDKQVYRSDEKRGPLAKTVDFSLHLSNTYAQHDTTLFIPMDEMGLYECFIQVPNQNLKTLNTFSVSRLATVYRSTQKDLREVLVTDLQSGKPITKATVTYYTDRRMRMKVLGSVTTNKQGIAVLPSKASITAFQASKGDDSFGLISTVYFRSADPILEKEKMEVALFTDRGIYRPGQTIFFKGVAYVKDTDQPMVISNRTFQVRLQDANGKEVANKELKTNEFGSFHGEFTIPSYGLSGSYRLSTHLANAYVKVEEYKRPLFKASFQPIKETIAFNDNVTLTGKAETFSGVALTEGQVKWRIARRPFWLRFYPGQDNQTVLTEGETKLNANGSFQMSFKPKKEETHRLFSAYQAYEAIAVVTDSKGETQEARYTFVVGESSLVLSSPLPQQVERKAVKAIIEARTVNGEKQAVSGSYKLIELIDNPDQRHKSDLQEGKDVASGSFTTDQAIDPAVFKALPSGRYRLAFSAKDEKGRVCKNFTDFILYGKDDKRPPVFSHTWVLQDKTNCLPGETAEIIFGTSDKDAYVLYEWFVDHKRIRSERFKLSNENRHLFIPFKEVYGNGLVATFTFVKEGELYVSQISVKRQLPNRKLNICPMSFRDHLLPGQHESWRFRITDADSVIVSADVLASMYDASLDQLIPFNWYFAPECHIHLQAPKFAAGIGFLRNYQYDQSQVNYLKVPTYEYDQLNWFDLYSRKRHRFFPTSRNLIMKSAGNRAMDTMADEYVLEEETEQSLKNAPVPEATEDANAPTFDRSQLRKDFSETAFFYPTLRTNEAGDFIVDFKVPESNTTWKLQVLANTKDLKYGQFTQEIVTNKPLMITPNMPRFVRQGDRVTISAQVINHSKETTSGRASIELFDPSTNEPIICLSKALRMFELQPDSIATVQWTIPVPQGIHLMGVRMIARSDKSSDGEQHILPVLSNQLLVTESKPFYLLQPGEKRINIAKDKGSKTPFRITLELTSNPIWYAVQALPTIAEPTHENSLSWFAAFYSNTLATHIAQANPRIQEVITQWMAKGGNEQTLYSNLMKNQELKNILLEETPWVLAAENESEQKQRLSLLFNLNRASHLRTVASEKLRQEQHTDGGWSWLKGGHSSRSITLSILEGMAQMVELNAIQFSPAEKEMQIKAIKFLDLCILQDYKQLKDTKKFPQLVPTPEQIRYLYVRSAYRDIPELGDAKEAIRFYTKQAEKQWKNVALHEKAEIALLLHRNGLQETVNKIVDWLKKTATRTTEQGLYWANNRSTNHFFKSPIETHCLLMAVFNELEPNIERTNLMKQWLLNQKRTQNWESEPATINAIYALLLTGSDWLNSANQCSVRWGGQTYESANGEIATGYLKSVLPQPKFINDSKGETFIIQKEGNAPVWGAVYEQYFQEIQEIKAHKGNLQVEKRLFVESFEGNERHIRPVSEEHPLHVGNKVIVRLTIRTDRDMDYIYLKDLRAGCFESADPISRSEYRDGIMYYRSPKDVSENFYFDNIPQGTFVVEYPVYVTRSGEYSSGISTIQCLYAPEFISHTEGSLIQIKN